MIHIPFFIRLKYVLLNLTAIFGLLFTLAGGAAAWVFLSDLHLEHAVAMWWAKGSAEGVIFLAEPTDNAINDHLIYRYSYAFKPTENPDESYTGYAFGYQDYAEGTKISVKYVTDRPYISLPAGMDLYKGGGTSMLMLLFPLFGAIVLLSSTRERLEHLDILSRAKITIAKLIEASKISISERRTPDIFEFEDTQGQVHRIESYLRYDIIKTREQGWAFVAYDPENPKKAVIINAMHKYLRRIIARTDKRLEIERSA